jgi:hypothetical protein
VSRPKPDYDTTLARMAGRIAERLAPKLGVNYLRADPQGVARVCVAIARAIVAEVRATEPKETV